MEKCYLLRTATDVNNTKTSSIYGDDVGICRNIKTLVRVLNFTEGYTEITEDNVFSFEMRQKYNYIISEYNFLHFA
jgi:hypothetical protein